MVSIRWKDCDVSESVASHFENKLYKILKFSSVNKDLIKAEIVHYSKEKSFTVRLNVPIIGSSIIRSEAKSVDVLTAINEVIEKTLDQIRRIKTKRSRNH